MKLATEASLADTQNGVEEPEELDCPDCGENVLFDDTLMVQEKDGSSRVVCRECYDDIVENCEVCGNEDVEPIDFSRFIVVKANLSMTSTRMPGIYRVKNYPFLIGSVLGGGFMVTSAVEFVDCLPRPDVDSEGFKISGHICSRCAAPYESRWKEVYGRKCRGKNAGSREWERERAHVEATFQANPDRLRDLESNSYAVENLRKLFRFPATLPTWHEHLVIEHRGVKVFYAGYQREDSWMTWHPEPSFRSGGHGKDCFHPSELPTYERRANEAQREYRAKHRESPHLTLDGVALLQTAARPAIRDAIDLGALTQNGPAEKSSPLWKASLPPL